MQVDILEMVIFSLQIFIGIRNFAKRLFLIMPRFGAFIFLILVR